MVMRLTGSAKRSARAGVDYVSSTVLFGSAVALTTIVAADVTSISLPAGTWYVTGNVGFAPNAATTQTTLGGWISTTSAALPTAPNNGAEFFFVMPFTAGSANIVPVGSIQLILAATTTVYLSAYAQFGVNTNAAYGHIHARRIRIL